MISSQGIQDNLYNLYGDLAKSGLVDAGTAGGCRYIRHVGSAWPNMAYPGESIGGVDLAALVEAVKAKSCPRLILFEEAAVTTEGMAEMSRFRFVPAAHWINMTVTLGGMTVTLEGMTVALGAQDKQRNGKLECRIVDARNAAEWNDWSIVAEEVLFKKEKLAADLFRYGCERGFFNLMIGYYDGRPVSTSLLYKGKLAGVYMVATLPSFQGKGLGKELMGFTGSVALAEGYSDLVLHSTKAGLPLYERLGYQQKGKLLLFYCMD
jgi:GNAT superfamily N-acetyltransferase